MTESSPARVSTYDDKLKHSKVRNSADREAVVTYAIHQGSKFALGVFGLTVAGSLAMHRFVPWYRKCYLPVKVAFVTSATLASFYFKAESETLKYEREWAAKYAIRKDLASVLNPELVAAIPTEILGPAVPTENSLAMTMADYKKYILKNRFELVGYLWLTTAVSTILYLWRKPIPISDKLINARLYSQTLGLTAFFGFAGAAAVGEDPEADEEEQDTHYNRVVYGGPKKV